MRSTTLGPRLATLAVLFGLGIWGGEQASQGGFSALLWAALALLAVLWLPSRARILALVLLLGGIRGALDSGSAGVIVGSDDRGLDEVRGLVSGPIERVRGGRRWKLDIGSAQVLINERGLGSVLPGDLVLVRGRLRTPRGYRVPGLESASRAGPSRSVAAIMTVSSADLERLESAAVWSGWRVPAQIHRHMAGAVVDRGGAPRGNAVVRAMVIGDRSGLDHTIVEPFRDAGVSHVLAVSGLHLAVVCLLFFSAVRKLWSSVPALTLRLSSSRVAALLAVPAAIAYTLTTGARVSTLRALVVVLIVLGGVVLARRARLIDALGAAALIILSVHPTSIHDPSFQLSFSATAVLALAMGQSSLGHGAGRLVSAVLSLGRASLWAFVATAPFTALWFGSVAPGGLVANVVVVPVVELFVLPIGLAGMLLQQVWPTGGGTLVDAAVAVANVLVALVAWMASWMPVLHVSPPTAPHMLAAIAILSGAVCWARGYASKTISQSLFLAGAAALLLTILVVDGIQPRLRTGLRVVFLDVGQGDSAVVELPGGQVWLIDTGGRPFVFDPGISEAERQRRGESPGELSVSRYLSSRRVRTIERVVLTHPHPDHYLGIRALARRFAIGELWISQPHAETVPPADYLSLLVQLRLGGTRIVHPPIDQPMQTRGVQVTVLHPWHHRRVAADDPSLGVNDDSLVLLLQWASRSMLFAGDLEAEGEEVLLERLGGSLPVDVVKVGHHGSKTSSTPALVAATRPSMAVISCGRANRFGFPDSGVVARWRRVGARVLRTDLLGSITIEIGADGVMHVTPGGSGAE